MTSEPFQLVLTMGDNGMDTFFGNSFVPDDDNQRRIDELYANLRPIEAFNHSVEAFSTAMGYPEASVQVRSTSPCFPSVPRRYLTRVDRFRLTSLNITSMVQFRR